MFFLALFFNISREVPFALFALKTLRVSICFWPYFNRMYVENISKRMISFFRSETYIIYFSVFYVVLINMVTVVSYYPLRDDQNYFIYEFFCPKCTTPIDIVVNSIRFVSLGGVFILSLWTYK